MPSTNLLKSFCRFDDSVEYPTTCLLFRSCDSPEECVQDCLYSLTGWADSWFLLILKLLVVENSHYLKFEYLSQIEMEDDDMQQSPEDKESTPPHGTK